MSKRGSRPRPVSSLFGRLLPPDFARQRVLIEQYQQFFNSLDSDPAFALVQVLHVRERELAVALPSPAHAAWLRRNQPQLEQAIQEQFGQRLSLNIRVDPELMTPRKVAPGLPPARPVRRETAERIERSAAAIDDEALSRALKSLARTLKNNTSG